MGIKDLKVNVVYGGVYIKMKESHQDKELERVIKALANRRRLAILRYLRKGREASVGDITEEINLSFKSTSRHLAVLSAVHLVDRDQIGTKMYYRITEKIPEVARKIIFII